MIKTIKKIFSKDSTEDLNIPQTLSYTSLKDDFSIQLSENHATGFIENKELSELILKKIKPNTKIIFLIDDNCFIMGMLEEELQQRLGDSEEYTIIAMCSSYVAYDFMTLITKYNIKPDYLIVDIEFGQIERINEKNVKLDGIDLLIESHLINNEISYKLFTGNVITKETAINYDYVKKYEYYFGEKILDSVLIKDTALNFGIGEDIFSIIFDRK